MKVHTMHRPSFERLPHCHGHQAGLTNTIRSTVGDAGHAMPMSHSIPASASRWF